LASRKTWTIDQKHPANEIAISTQP
jgi:hypothetical protein